MERLVLGNELDVEECVSKDGFVVDNVGDDDSMELFRSLSNGNEDQRKGRFSSLASRPFVWNSNRKSQFAKFISPSEKSEGVPVSCKDKQRKGISESELPEIEMVKERLSKLLLGEDMSGSGNGVQTALAISNAVTNLSASVFGQLWRLEPLPQIKKSMWRREMECLLCVTNYIVVLSPSWHIYPDGSKVEIMSSKPRSDLAANLPALRKLDSMLQEILDCFTNTEFWYVEKGLSNSEVEHDALTASSKTLQNQEEKWWLPVPHVPPNGLGISTRKMLQNKRDCAKQILKAVTAINNMTLADMEVPEFYYDSIPKHPKDCLGEKLYRYISSHRFSAERCLTSLGIASDHHQALKVANQVEAAIFAFHRRSHLKDLKRLNHSSKHSWELVKDLAIEAPKTELLVGRAESLLLCLKQQFPGLPQTTLDSIKIQHNRDIGKSILESYSRVLESLAFNILTRIDDVLCVDDDVAARKSSKCSEKNTLVQASNTNNSKALVQKTTLMSHIPSLQTSSSEDFEI